MAPGCSWLSRDSHPPLVVRQGVLRVAQQLKKVVAPRQRRAFLLAPAPFPRHERGVRNRAPSRGALGRRLRALHLCTQARALQQQEELHLAVVQIGVPHVEDEHDARAVAVVPRLVLERVVEGKAPPLHALVRAIGDTKPGAFHSNEGQMHAQLLVCGAVVLNDVRAGRERREESVVVRPRQRCEERDGDGAARAVVCEGQLVQREVKHVPLARVVRE
mmetsp:Transcript_36527/g.117768  ORF Transcript_36527/g.117768 Transcript_36527/m.117768 type:complete len:218 (+) Transcript_36527:93-746(+)